MGVLAISGAGLYGVGADPSILGAEGLTAFPVFGDFESIATVTLATSAASITFSDIPQGYKHLQLRMLIRTNFNWPSSVPVFVNFNGETGNVNLSKHIIYGNGSSIGAYGSGNDRGFGGTARLGTLANVYSAVIVDILDYSSTEKFTTMRGITGEDENGATTGVVQIDSNCWRSTAAVSSILITPFGSGANFVQHNTAALYGIRG